jgi:hypothetical protein
MDGFSSSFFPSSHVVDAIAEDEIVIADTGVAVGGVRMAMEQNIKILSLEKQLEQERQRRNKYNQAKYAQGKK